MKSNDILSEYIPIEVPDISETENEPSNYWERTAKEKREMALSWDRYRYYTHSNPAKILQRYLLEDCVIAYIKDIFGAMFILKSKQKYFAFFCKNKELYLGGMGYSIMDTPIKEALQYLEKVPEKYKQDKNNFQIVDEAELQRARNMVLFEAIKESG